MSCIHCHQEPVAYVHRQLCRLCNSDATIRRLHPDPYAGEDEAEITEEPAPPTQNYCCVCLAVVNKSSGVRCPKCAEVGFSRPPYTTAQVCEPTDALPGTHDKILAMRKRADVSGIFHPLDARDHDDAKGIKAEEGTLNFPPVLPYDGRDSADETDLLADLATVDPADDFRAVPQLVGDLVLGQPSLDPIASVGVPQAVGRKPIDNSVIQTKPQARTAKVMAPCVLTPRVTVAVSEHVITLADSPDCTEQPHRKRIKADDPCPARTPDRFVLGEKKVGKLSIEPHTIPGELPHLAGSTTGAIQKQQPPLQGTAGNFHQLGKLFVGRRPSGLGYKTSEGSRGSIRAYRDQLLIAGPVEAGQDRGNPRTLRVDRLPRRMMQQKFADVVLPALGNGFCAESLSKIGKVTRVVFLNLQGKVAAVGARGDVRQILCNNLGYFHLMLSG